MYLLDTDILLHLWQGNQSVKERLLDADDTEVAITAITKAEILRVRCENLLKANDVTLVVKAQQRFTRTEQLL
jgi:tRNA(fMet)-specific endonuclease VapC